LQTVKILTSQQIPTQAIKNRKEPWLRKLIKLDQEMTMISNDSRKELSTEEFTMISN
jgi:hypothetical protein